MRKAQKEQAEKLVCLLDRVHDGIKMSIETGQKDQALDFLGQCQSGAINLGEAIEETEGEGFVTVKHLEEYCETVYQIYEKLRQEQSVSANQAFKGLRRSLTQVKNSIRNDIHVRTEVVFLPYKASMWDSLESVWKAAEEDPECDAYVIPIPYYDRNPDGSFREEHYEGSLYPEYVPVTSYQDYDFEEHRPDVVFIHNPYDECNYVTSVHPFFYARNLKQYTDKLVYIPYFILNEIDPENAAAVKGIEHFCTVPGVIYADKVIVQSENMRQAYVNVMTEFAEENSLEGMDRKYWEEKILGLGSPKVDKVLNTRREDLEIPKEWLRIIEKPDGSWKKIIFYNTSVTTLLQYSEHYLEKMKDVFRVFYENREDVALLWRPHPLIKATIESMRPELWSEYQKMAEAYRKDGWGIYDDTADIDRAVAICDAYYGDGSSVVKLCREKGVLAMVQNVDYRQNDITFFPCSIDGTWQENNEIWFVGNEDNMLWHMNILTDEIQYMATLPTKNKENTFRMNTRCIKEGNNIFCLPDRADRIVIYDIITKNTESFMIDIGESHTYLIDRSENRIGIYNAWKCGSKIWCVSYFLQNIIEIDIDNKCVGGIYPVFEDEETLIGYEAAMHRECIYCVSRNTKKIFKFNTITKSVKYYNPQVNDKGFNTIVSDENMFYLTGYKKAIYIWNEERDSIVPLDMFPQKYHVLNKQGLETDFYDMPIFYRSLVMESYILFLPWNFLDAFSNALIAYRKSDQKVVLVDSGDEKESLFSFCYRKSGDTVGIYCSVENGIFEVDNSFRLQCVKQFDVPEYWDAMKKRNVMTEGTIYDLKTLLNAVKGELTK